jgi:hypothetical protein
MLCHRPLRPLADTRTVAEGTDTGTMTDWSPATRLTGADHPKCATVCLTDLGGAADQIGGYLRTRY